MSPSDPHVLTLEAVLAEQDAVLDLLLAHIRKQRDAGTISENAAAVALTIARRKHENMTGLLREAFMAAFCSPEVITGNGDGITAAT